MNIKLFFRTLRRFQSASSRPCPCRKLLKKFLAGIVSLISSFRIRVGLNIYLHSLVLDKSYHAIDDKMVFHRVRVLLGVE